jgi:RHS repeat-associated protein
VRGTVSEPATVTIGGQTASITDVAGTLQWETNLALAPGINTFPITATETTVAAGAQAQVRSKTLQITEPTQRTLLYDNNGNLTDDAVGRTFEWDAADRLVAVNEAGTNRRSEFSYDGLSRRVRIIEKKGMAVLSDRRYVWDGLEEYEERDTATNVVLKRYYPSGFQVIDGAQTTSYLYNRDHLRSIREVIDIQTNAVVARYAYDPYGNRTKTEGIAVFDADFGFTGHWYHPQSNLHFAPFRAYDAALGRWLSRDPAGEDGGLNLYGYAYNSPLQYVDLDGRNPVLILVGLSLLLDTEWANAPGPGDPTYNARGPIAPVVDIAAAQTAGAVAGALLRGTTRLIKAPPCRTPALPGEYLAGDAPKFVTPGTRVLEGQHINDLGRVEPWRAYYDEYGRMIGRTDFNAGNKAAGIPSVHHHTYEYNAQYPLGRETGAHLPGEFHP